MKHIYEMELFGDTQDKIKNILNSNNKLDVKPNEYYICNSDFKNFKAGESYKVLGAVDGYVYLRYYRDNRPIKFKMTINTFLKHFSTDDNNDENKFEPFYDDNWEKPEKHIYTIALGRDYDIVGYVVAYDKEDAKQKSLDNGMVEKDMSRFIRADVLEDKYVNNTLKRRKTEAMNANAIYESLLNSINDLNK